MFKDTGLIHHFRIWNFRRQLASGRESVRERAIEKVSARPTEEKLALLLDYLKNNQERHRIIHFGIECFVKVDYKPAIPFLKDLFQDHNGNFIRASACEALFSLGAPFDEQDLIIKYRKEEHAAYTAIVTVLGKIGGRNAAVHLSRSLEEKSGEAGTDEWHIIHALTNIKDPISAPVLLKWIKDHNQYSAEAAIALVVINDPATICEMIRMLNEDDRYFLARELGKLRTEEVYQAIAAAYQRLYRSPKPDRTSEAALVQGFNHLADPRVLPYIHQTLETHWGRYYADGACDYNVAIHITAPALETLQKIGDVSSLKFLLNFEKKDYTGKLFKTLEVLTRKCIRSLDGDALLALSRLEVSEVHAGKECDGLSKLNTGSIRRLAKEELERRK